MSTWIVSTGDYSDYRVLFACPDEATARASAERIAGEPADRAHSDQFGDYRVEEIPTVTDAAELRAEMRYFVAINEYERVSFTTIPRLVEHCSSTVQWSLGDPLPEPRLDCYGPGPNDSRGWAVYTQASYYRSEAEAWKVAREAHARAVAERTGL